VAGQDEMNDEFVPDPRKDMVGHAVFAAEVDQGQLRRGLSQIFKAFKILFICKFAGAHGNPPMRYRMKTPVMLQL
jgi:hypothetical protein